MVARSTISAELCDRKNTDTL